MSLQLLPLEEEDLLAFARITDLAFREDGLIDALYPQGFGESSIQWYSKKLLQDFRRGGSTTRFNKVIDTSLPDDDPFQKIISVAKWSFYATGRSKVELDAEDKKDEEGLSEGSGANLELMDAFHGEMARNRRRVWGGRPYVFLHLLGTHPNHHRRGSGARQLQWGLAAADELNLPIWLEASGSGRSLYERFGFRVIDKVDFDPVRWGLKKDFVAVNMLRSAVVANVSVAPISTILVLGAGELGIEVLHALAAHSSVLRGQTKIAVLLRPGSKSREIVRQISPAFAILTEDIAAASAETLADHFKLFDGIISCTGFAGGPGTQRKIADAAALAGRATAGVKRFIPWQFGVDYDTFGRGGRMELWDEQLDVRDQLRSESWPKNVQWMIVSTGIFTSFIFEENFGVVTGMKKAGLPVTIQALGGLDNKVTTTSVRDIGKITVNVLFDAAVTNQIVYTAGQTVSYTELAKELALIVKGRKKQTQVVEKSVAALLEELSEDPDNAYKKYRVVFAEGRGVSWSPAKTYNFQHGMPTDTIRDWVAKNASIVE